MADGDLDASVAPRQRYYLCIDGTGAEDSVEYGRLLQEKFGWRNLLTEFLQPDPAAAKGQERLIDPNHPFLPICTFPAAGQKKPIAVVCPNGRDGKGLDDFWANYSGEAPDEKPNGRHVFTPAGTTVQIELFGRHTAATKSALFMRDLMLVPAIEKITDAQGKSFAQLTDGLLSGTRNPTEPDIRAELLLVSSHGWLGGFMQGDSLRASPAAQPAAAQPEFAPPFVYFLAGLAAVERAFFVGPKWIILAQCSTVNAATWLHWVKLMKDGLPPVRGILAYEEVSPGVVGSIQIARSFFANLEAGQPLLRAWRAANSGQKWAAIVHREAVGDLMRKWDAFAALKTVEVTATTSAYLAFGASLEALPAADRPNDGKGLVDFAAQDVLDKPPPFGVKIETAKPNPPVPRPFEEITDDTLNRARGKLVGEMQVRMTVTAPAGGRIASATVRWIHMRESRNPQIPLTTLFQSFTPEPAGSLQLMVSTKDPRTPNTLEVQPTGGPVDSFAILWTTQTQAVLSRSGMEASHSFVWPLIKLQLVGQTKPLLFPFSTRGLLF